MFFVWLLSGENQISTVGLKNIGWHIIFYMNHMGDIKMKDYKQLFGYAAILFGIGFVIGREDLLKPNRLRPHRNGVDFVARGGLFWSF